MNKLTILGSLLLFALLFTSCNIGFATISTEISNNKTQTEANTSEEETLQKTNPSEHIQWDISKYQIMCTAQVYDKLDVIEICDSSADSWRYSHIIHPKTVEVKLGENAHIGEYQGKEYRANVHHPCYMYKTASGNEFELDENGMLNYFYLDSSNRPVLNYNNILSEEECVKRAKDIFENYYKNFVDTTSYRVYSVEGYDYSDDSNEQYTEYSVVFSQYIDGIRTADLVSVSVNLNGVLYSIHAYNCGRVPDDINISNIDTKEINSVLDRVIEYIYEDSKNKYEYEISRSDLFISQIGYERWGVGSAIETTKSLKSNPAFQTLERYNLYVKLPLGL